MDELFKNESQYIYLYCAKATINDPFEKTQTLTELSPIPINAIVTDLSPTAMQWKAPGIITDSAKEILIEKKNKNLLLMSQKIRVKNSNIDYYGWKINGKLSYREEGFYLRCYIYAKQD